MSEEGPDVTLDTLPIDSEASMYPWIAVSPVSLLLVCLLFARSNKERKTLVLAGFVLLCVWAYRFRSLLFFQH